MLPWLALLGRCCLAYADAVSTPGDAQWGDEVWVMMRFLRLPGIAASAFKIASLLLPETWPADSHEVPDGRAAASMLLLLRLDSMGVDVPALRAAAADTHNAASAAHDMLNAAADDAVRQSRTAPPLHRVLPRQLRSMLEPGGQLPVALEALGAALSAVPCRASCNAPRCISLVGSTEQQLVKGSGKVCSACHTVRYCCKLCQRAAWKRHKPVCKALQAEAAAAAAASSGPEGGGQAGAGSSVGAPAWMAGLQAHAAQHGVGQE
jgi:hypothetical protein